MIPHTATEEEMMNSTFLTGSSVQEKAKIQKNINPKTLSAPMEKGVLNLSWRPSQGYRHLQANCQGRRCGATVR